MIKFDLHNILVVSYSIELVVSKLVFVSLQHAEMTDEIVQLKTLQTMLILFQSHLHPESEVATINGYNFFLCVEGFLRVISLANLRTCGSFYLSK